MTTETVDQKSAEDVDVERKKSVDMDRPPSSEKEEKEATDFELTGSKLLFVMIGLALSLFLMSIDTSIIATAIPRITSQFGSTDDIGWYGSAYSFSMCAFQPIAGKLFANFSMKVCHRSSLSFSLSLPL
jgi:hypothetical protein